jgi:WD40 repeat protein
MLRDLKGHGDKVNSAAFSPDGARMVTASFDGTAQVWDAAGDTPEIQITEAHAAYPCMLRPTYPSKKLSCATNPATQVSQGSESHRRSYRACLG